MRAANVQRVRINKAAFAEKNIDASVSIALDGIDRTEIGLDAPNALHHFVKMDGGAMRFNAKFARRHDLAHDLSRADDRLGRYTTHV